MISVVYILTFANDKRYVGMSCYPKKRIPQHAKSKYVVGCAWRKYGEPDIQIAFSGAKNECKMREVRLIENLNTRVPFGYNLTCGGEGLCDPSPETRQKISNYSRNRKHSKETRLRISKSLEGHASNLRGITLSVEHCRKLSEAHQGKKRGPFSPEHRRRMSEAQKGKKHTDETKAKMRGPRGPYKQRRNS